MAPRGRRKNAKKVEEPEDSADELLRPDLELKIEVEDHEIPVADTDVAETGSQLQSQEKFTLKLRNVESLLECPGNPSSGLPVISDDIGVPDDPDDPGVPDDPDDPAAPGYPNDLDALDDPLVHPNRNRAPVLSAIIAAKEAGRSRKKITDTSAKEKDVANGDDVSRRVEHRDPDGMHTCILGEKYPLPDHIAKKDRCTKVNPVKMPYKEIPFHYYLHYKDRGAWDAVVPPLKSEDRDRVESFECQICRGKSGTGSFVGPRFRVKLGEDPEPQRCSFIYHFAHHHGKLVDAMREDKDNDMTRILGLIKEHIPSYRSFMVNGTKTDYDDSPAIVNNRTEWTVRNKQLMESSRHATSPHTGIVRATMTHNTFFPCPKMNKPSCKETVRGRSKSDLKLHLTTEHYIHYWKDSVPEMSSLEARCSDCRSFRAQGATLSGCRTSMVCHRAMAHNELRDALEEDDEISKDFIEELYSEKPKALTKEDLLNGSGTKQVAPAEKIDQITKEVEERSKNAAILAVQSKDKKKSGRPLKAVAEPDLEEAIPAQPYVRKRIRQNLSAIDFAENTDSDEDWDLDASKKQKLGAVGRKSLPERSRRGGRRKIVEADSSDFTESD